MKTELAVMNSDRINRYGMKFSVPTLFNTAQEAWDTGSPILISHDYHRPAGWVRPFGVHIEPGQSRLVGLLQFAENDLERDNIKSSLEAYLAKKYAEALENHKEEFNEYLKPIIGEDYKFCLPGEVGVFQPGIVPKLFPEIFSKKDGNNLIDYRELEEISPGVFKIGRFAVFAHRFFRRSISYFNPMNGHFLKLFSSLKSDKSLSLRIAIDEDVVALASSVKEKIELEYWRGPFFSSDLSKIEIGCSVYGADDTQKFYHGILRTEFLWSEKKDEFSFECEEVLDTPSNGRGEDDYGCRYVHSILAPGKSVPNHLDGAIRLYDTELMLERINPNTDISKFGKKAAYFKLWRIDGEIENAKWKALISDYFRFNDLVGEYFEGENGKGGTGPALIKCEPENIPLSDFIPTEMSKGMGVRIAASLFSKPEGIQDGITILPRDTIKWGDEMFHFLDFQSIEIIKALRKNETKVHVQGNPKFICYKDSTTNYPLILHIGNDALSLAQKTSDAISTMLKHFQKRDDDRLISLNLAVDFSGQMVLFSAAGHLNDLCDWLSCGESMFPKSLEKISEWCENNSEWLSQNFKVQNGNPPLEQMLMKSGILMFARRMAGPENFDIIKEDSEGMKFVFHFPSDSKLLEAIDAGNIHLAQVFDVIKSSCSIHKADYQACNCLKGVDPGAYSIIEESRFMGLTWTKRNSVSGLKWIPDPEQ